MNAITTLPINDQTASYTLVVGDVGKRVIMNNASANTVTVNNSVFAAGDTIFIANKGAGTSTITAGAGVTINTADSLAIAQYQSGTLVALSASSFLFFLTTKTLTVTPRIGQVVNVIKTDAFSTTSTSFVDVTGMSVTITPTSASSKVLVLTGLALSAGAARGYATLLRGASAIADSTGFATSNQTSCTYGSNYLSQYVSISYLDSPATTSATTYKFQVKADSGTTTYVNTQAGATAHGNVSTITVMEYLP